MVYTIASDDIHKLNINRQFMTMLRTIKGKHKKKIVYIDTANLCTTKFLHCLPNVDLHVVNCSRVECEKIKEGAPYVTIYCMMFNEFVKKNINKKFDAIYMDTCGTLFSNCDAVSEMFKNHMLRPGGLFLCTFVFRGDLAIGKNYKHSPKESYNSWLKDGIPEFKNDTPVIKRSNWFIHDLALQSGYMLERFTEDDGIDTHYRSSVYILRYKVV